jgi:hypothetical protein
MSYTIEVLPGEPIIFAALSESFSIERDLPVAIGTILELLEGMDGKCFFIVDSGGFVPDLHGIVTSASMMARGENPVWHHPNIWEVIVVTSVSIVKLGAEGLRHAAFGHLKIQAFSTAEDALDYAREKIAEG